MRLRRDASTQQMRVYTYSITAIGMKNEPIAENTT